MSHSKGCLGLCTGAGIPAAHATHSNTVIGYCVRLLGDGGLAEEIAKEPFVRAWRHCPGVVGADPNWLRCWLLAIAGTLVIDAAGARRRRPPLAQPHRPVAEPGVDQV